MTTRIRPLHAFAARSGVALLASSLVIASSAAPARPASQGNTNAPTTSARLQAPLWGEPDFSNKYVLVRDVLLTPALKGILGVCHKINVTTQAGRYIRGMRDIVTDFSLSATCIVNPRIPLRTGSYCPYIVSIDGRIYRHNGYGIDYIRFHRFCPAA